jgi:hypothetical protein
MRLQFQWKPWGKVALVLYVVLYLPAGFATVLSSPPQGEYRSLSERIEQIETRDAFRLEASELAQNIEAARNDLEAYIAANATDVNAMVLSARLGYIDEIYVKSKQEANEQNVDPGEKFIVEHQRLDKALELRPDDARISYWKARLYGMNARVIDDQGNPKNRPIDLDKAIHFAQQAVLLDRQNVWYREALAIYYITANNRKAALELLDTALTEHKPVNILLKDIDAFPLPEGTVYPEEDSKLYGELQFRQKIITNFPQLRAQVFVVPLSAARLEKFFQQTWPGFRFFKQPQAGVYAQYLVFDSKGLRPTYNMAEARTMAQKSQGGIILSVMDVTNPTAAERESTPEGHPLPASLGDSFSYVFYVNNKKVE